SSTMRFTSLSMNSLLGLGEGAGAAVTGGPFHRIVEEGFDFAQRRGIEIALVARHLEHVPPGSERMHLQAELLQRVLRFREDVVMEDDEGMLDLEAGGAQRLAE